MLQGSAPDGKRGRLGPHFLQGNSGARVEAECAQEQGQCQDVEPLHQVTEMGWLQRGNELCLPGAGQQRWLAVCNSTVAGETLARGNFLPQPTYLPNPILALWATAHYTLVRCSEPALMLRACWDY